MGHQSSARTRCCIIPAAVKARRVSGRNLSNSEFAELLPITGATWEREPGQSEGDFVQMHRPWNWWLTLTCKDVVSKTYALSLLKEWARELRRASASARDATVQARRSPH